MLEKIISEIVRKYAKEQETIIRQAFLRHFGYPIEDADTSKLDRAVVLGSPVEQFRYAGETFLLWDESETPELQKGVNTYTMQCTLKYLEV